MLLPQPDLFLKYLYIEEILFVTNITLVKLSILSFYKDIFDVKRFHQRAWILGGVYITWYLICVSIIVFQCRPINAAWHIELQMVPRASKCVQVGRFTFGLEISNVAIDLSILFLPVYMVQRLQMKMEKKASILGIFLFGGFVCVSCIVRTYWDFDPKTAEARSLAAAMDWITVELAIAVVCACLPTYAPFLRFTLVSANSKDWYASLRSNFRASQRSNGPQPVPASSSRVRPAGAKTSKHSHHDQTYDGWADNKHLIQAVGKPKSLARDWNDMSYPMNEIQVERTVEVV